MVVGSDKGYPQNFGFEFDGELMVLPVPDTYEQLASKVFYAYLILSMCGPPSLVVKVDDDVSLRDSGQFMSFLRMIKGDNVQYCGKLIRVSHRDQCHGWHVGKCADTAMNLRGYQYPMPQVNASGGFGYEIGPRLLEECALMYLSMQSFFELQCIQLEDVFVGLAAQGAGIVASTCEDDSLMDLSYSDVATAVLPGLIRLPEA